MQQEVQMQQQIRKRPDGSIDTGFYVERGLRFRSLTAHSLWRRSRTTDFDF